LLTITKAVERHNAWSQAHPAGHGGKETLTMIHNLTVGHLDTDAIERERRVRVLRPLEMEPVNRVYLSAWGVRREISRNDFARERLPALAANAPILARECADHPREWEHHSPSLVQLEPVRATFLVKSPAGGILSAGDTRGGGR
jgi:hypothetical protein